MQKQLQRYLIWSDAMPSHQSAYRQFHGTETALIKVMNDLLVATDEGQVSALCLLDLTGAPKNTTDKLQRVRNAAARVLSNRGKSPTED